MNQGLFAAAAAARFSSSFCRFLADARAGASFPGRTRGEHMRRSSVRSSSHSPPSPITTTAAAGRVSKRRLSGLIPFSAQRRVRSPSCCTRRRLSERRTPHPTSRPCPDRNPVLELWCGEERSGYRGPGLSLNPLRTLEHTAAFATQPELGERELPTNVIKTCIFNTKVDSD